MLTLYPMEKIVIVSGKRTPFGAFGGSLKDVSATQLGVYSAKATLEQVGLSADHIDHVMSFNLDQMPHIFRVTSA